MGEGCGVIGLTGAEVFAVGPCLMARNEQLLSDVEDLPVASGDALARAHLSDGLAFRQLAEGSTRNTSKWLDHMQAAVTAFEKAAEVFGEDNHAQFAVAMHNVGQVAAVVGRGWDKKTNDTAAEALCIAAVSYEAAGDDAGGAEAWAQAGYAYWEAKDPKSSKCWTVAVEAYLKCENRIDAAHIQHADLWCTDDRTWSELLAGRGKTAKHRAAFLEIKEASDEITKVFVEHKEGMALFLVRALGASAALGEGMASAMGSSVYGVSLPNVIGPALVLATEIDGEDWSEDPGSEAYRSSESLRSYFLSSLELRCEDAARLWIASIDEWRTDAEATPPPRKDSIDQLLAWGRWSSWGRHVLRLAQHQAKQGEVTAALELLREVVAHESEIRDENVFIGPRVVSAARRMIAKLDSAPPSVQSIEGSATGEGTRPITDAPAGVETDVAVREPFAEASAVEILAALQPEVPDAAVSRLTTIIRGAQTSPPADRAAFVAGFNEALDALNLRIRIDGGEELARLKFIKTSKAGSIQLGLSGRSRGLRGVELEVVRASVVSRRVAPSQEVSP